MHTNQISHNSDKVKSVAACSHELFIWLQRWIKLPFIRIISIKILYEREMGINYLCKF